MTPSSPIATLVFSITFYLSFLVGGGLLIPPHAHGAFNASKVGAKTAFNMSNSLSLANYPRLANETDDTGRIKRWMDAARNSSSTPANRKHLYAPAGTYEYVSGITLFSGCHIKGAGTSSTIFKSKNGANTLFGLLANWGSSNSIPEPWEDISFQDFAVDMDGCTSNFRGPIAMSGNTQPIRHVTVRGIRVFDTGGYSLWDDYPTHQGQYIAVTNSQYVLIEKNNLSDGGRIKAGRPGYAIIIRHNTLNKINDNGITIVDSWSNTSSDILIEGNTITDARGSGIFLGTDGQTSGDSACTTRDITVVNNTVTGFSSMPGGAAGVTGCLPNNTANIYIAHNTLRKTDGSNPCQGIQVFRNNTATLNATGVTIKDNSVTSDVTNYLNNKAGLAVLDRFNVVGIIGNTVSNQNTGIFFRDLNVARVIGNNFNGGSIRNDGGSSTIIDQSGNMSGVYIPTVRLGVNGSFGNLTVAKGAQVTVDWGVVPDAVNKDWLALYPTSAGDNYTSRVAWVYTCNGLQTGVSGLPPRSAGGHVFTMPTTAGQYHFRLYKNDGLIRWATSAVITVQ